MLIVNLIGVSLMLYMFSDFKLIAVIAITLIFFISTFPTIYLLINYLKNNINLTIRFNSESMVVISESAEDLIHIDDIENITFNGSKNLFEKHNIRFSTYDDFYYAEIKTKDGRKIVLTNLLSGDLKEFLKGNYPHIEVKYNYRLFPRIV